MNKIITSAILACSFAMSAMAAPAINFSDNSKIFLKERRAVDGYRTRDLAQKGLMKKGSEKDASRAPVVSVSSDATDFSAMEKSLVQKKYHVFDKTEDILAAVNYETGAKVDVNLVENNPQAAAAALMSSLFPGDVAKQFDFLVMDTELDEFDDGTSEIAEYIFNFVRVLNNRVVRGADKMSIYVSVDGVAEMVVVRMSNLEVTNEYVPTSEDYMENMTALNQLISEKFSVAYSNVEQKTVAIKNIDINGVAEAYCQEEKDSTVYQPCLSYSAVVVVENGDRIPYIFDAPYFSSSVVLADGNKSVGDDADEKDNGVKIVEVRRDMVAFELKKGGDAVVVFFNANGTRAMRVRVENARAGYNVVRVDATKIPRGRYTVTVEVDKKRGSKSVWLK
ncbi:MAG: hypothetical protein IK012_08930 [Fibrobacter sp.]|uniref:hypothetical protein n=1 Tax=Fibrobacter sp. TaxID=35828 RepID=UPI0025BC1C64|nr:hypothetical protein [Fibrobacter sp.]MBR4785357.1 hypothetical protein [Fibrobacter sp.]